MVASFSPEWQGLLSYLLSAVHGVGVAPGPAGLRGAVQQRGTRLFSDAGYGW